MSGLLGLVGGGVLFAEDFDLPERTEPQAEPEAAEPAFDRTELEAAKAAAFNEGAAAGRAELIAQDTVGLRLAVSALADELGAAQDAARMIGERAAEEVARLLMAALGAVLPAWCESLGDREACAVARIVLPALMGEPEITVRTHARTAPALLAEIARIDPDIAARVRMVPTDALAPGDLRIAWKDGLAVRDAAAIWREVAAILVPQGLLAGKGDMAVNGAGMEDTRNGE